MRYVYVLDMNGEPLMPTCRYGKVRRMLKFGQAKAVDTLPFTIQLLKPTKTRILQPVIAGQDPGRTNIGMAAVRSDGTELYRAHIETRNKEIVSLMNDRQSFRQASRRGERLARKLNGITARNVAQKCPCDGFPAVAQKSMFIFTRISRRWYPFCVNASLGFLKKKNWNCSQKVLSAKIYQSKMIHTGSAAEVQDEGKRLANHRNLLEKFSICPVYTGMNPVALLF